MARQLTLVALSAGAVLTGCSSQPDVLPGSFGFVEGFLGAVVADEPRASLVGRDVLSQGGTAADAAAAMYFTMAVTLPSRAGLGGGGVCLAFDALSGTTEVVDFTAPAPQTIAPSADRPNAIPANPRGIFALQARHGVLPWPSIISPAEQLARFGHPVSRAFAADLTAVGPALLADRDARTVFASPSGQLLKEGDVIKQLDLAATLGMMRARGVGPLYTGSYTNTFVDAVSRAGGSLSIEEMRGFMPQIRKTVRVEVGNEVAHFAPPPAAASSVAAVILAMLIEDGEFEGANVVEQAKIFSEVSLRAFADRETWLSAMGQSTQDPQSLTQGTRIEGLVRGLNANRRSSVDRFVLQPRNRHESPSATVFSAVDNRANAVVCAVTMNSAFGIGRIAPGTGVLLAAAPGTGGRGPVGLAPMLVVNENSREFRFAAAASGGVVASTALAWVAARVLLDEEGVESAIAAPRVHLSGDPDVTYHEPGLSAGALSALSTAGHRTAATPVIGYVNAIGCPDGLPVHPESCHMAVDPRGQGLASGSMR